MLYINTIHIINRMNHKEISMTISIEKNKIFAIIFHHVTFIFLKVLLRCVFMLEHWECGDKKKSKFLS